MIQGIKKERPHNKIALSRLFDYFYFVLQKGSITININTNGERIIDIKNANINWIMFFIYFSF